MKSKRVIERSDVHIFIGTTWETEELLRLHTWASTLSIYPYIKQHGQGHMGFLIWSFELHLIRWSILFISNNSKKKFDIFLVTKAVQLSVISVVRSNSCICKSNKTLNCYIT